MKTIFKQYDNYVDNSPLLRTATTVAELFGLEHGSAERDKVIIISLIDTIEKLTKVQELQPQDRETLVKELEDKRERIKELEHKVECLTTDVANLQNIITKIKKLDSAGSKNA